MTTDLMALQRAIDAASKRIDEAYHRAARAAGLSDSSFDILYALHVAGEGCSQRRLCELCFTGKQTVNSAIKRLQDEGTLRVEPGTGRMTRIFLTQQGRRIVAERIAPIIDAELAALTTIPSGQRATLVSALTTYSTALSSEFDAIGSTG